MTPLSLRGFRRLTVDKVSAVVVRAEDGEAAELLETDEELGVSLKGNIKPDWGR